MIMGIFHKQNTFSVEQISNVSTVKFLVSAHIERTSGIVEIIWLSGSDEPTILVNKYGD